MAGQGMGGGGAGGGATAQQVGQMNVSRLSNNNKLLLKFNFISLTARSAADAWPDGRSQPAGTTADGWSQPTGTTADDSTATTTSARPDDATGGTANCRGDDGTAPSGGPTTGMWWGIRFSATSKLVAPHLKCLKDTCFGVLNY